jgi:hypothetical protein
MPNYCFNLLNIYHEDTSKIEEIIQSFKKEELFNSIIPCPDGWDYNFCVENWKTKWDAPCSDPDSQIDMLDDNHAILTFDTAWGPPTGIYEELHKRGYVITAHYIELGNELAGSFMDGEDTEYEFFYTLEDTLEEMPTCFLDIFGEEIVDHYENREVSDNSY